MTKPNRTYDTNILRAYFAYNPNTGQPVIQNSPLARNVTRVNQTQFKLGKTSYSVHRIVWALHHPENPSPKYVLFADGNPTNTHIENLVPKEVHPRWENYVKQVPHRSLPDGTLLPVTEYPAALAAYKRQQRAKIAQLPQPALPSVATSIALRNTFLNRLKKPNASEGDLAPWEQKVLRDAEQRGAKEREHNTMLDDFDWEAGTIPRKLTTAPTPTPAPTVQTKPLPEVIPADTVEDGIWLGWREGLRLGDGCEP